jgi:hypothetical protein
MGVRPRPQYEDSCHGMDVARRVRRGEGRWVRWACLCCSRGGLTPDTPCVTAASGAEKARAVILSHVTKDEPMRGFAHFF